MLFGMRHWLLAGIVTLLVPYGATGCFTELCGSHALRCATGNRLQVCSSEQDAWLDLLRCSRVGGDGACVSPASDVAFCSMTKDPVLQCNGHDQACVNGTLVLCWYGYAKAFDETCPAGACVEEAGEARCSVSSADAGTGDADVPD